MFKKFCSVAGLVVGAAAGALLLSSPAHADNRNSNNGKNTIIINNYNTNTNTNTATSANNNLATFNIPDPMALANAALSKIEIH